MVDVLNRHLAQSPFRSVHGLAKAVPTVSRSQLYLLLRGQAVIDLAELFAICEALRVSAASGARGGRGGRGERGSGMAAYDEPHPIEDEQGAPEEP